MTDSKSGKIHSIDQLRLQVTRTDLPWLLIHAIGRAQSSGWLNGELSQHIHVTPPSDGIQDFVFIAKMPLVGSSVLNVLTPISAHAELQEIDIANYWGEGMPLHGIRVHAVSNVKLVEIHSREKTSELTAKMSPQATASYVNESGSDKTPGFEEDIKPLFRERDVIVMEAVKGFNLHKYDDVKEWADRIQPRLDVNMPCDGLWPQSDRDKFAAWKDGGMPA